MWRVEVGYDRTGCPGGVVARPRKYPEGTRTSVNCSAELLAALHDLRTFAKLSSRESLDKFALPRLRKAADKAVAEFRKRLDAGGS